MTKQTHCKFCRCVIYLRYDEAYERIGDFLKLEQLGCCDRCADLREERRRITDQIKSACHWVSQIPDQKRNATKGLMQLLSELTMRYAKLVAKWHNLDGHWWDEAFPEMMRDHPDKWPKILADYWTHFRQMNPPKLL